MTSQSRNFKILDTVYILTSILPIISGILLKLLTYPQGNEISITGARIFFTIKMPLQNLPVTESQVNSLLVIVSITGLCLFLTHGIKEKADTKRQHIAEWIVEKTERLTAENMGDYFSGFAPFVTAMLGLSAFSSLLSLSGLYAPTSDLNINAGWAVLVFVLITYYKLKCGMVQYLKSFAEPVKFLAPLNVISEAATPVSMAFRHYGNILSGTVISVLVSAALQGFSALLLGGLPGILADIPLFQVGIPAVLSIYFDVFSGCLQAYIFAVLTMLYISGGFPAEEYFRRRAEKSTA